MARTSRPNSRPPARSSPSLKTWLEGFPALKEQAGTISLLLVTLFVALVTVIFGELLPKTLALAHAERYALLFARPVEILGAIFRPVVWVLNTINNRITSALGVKEIDRDRLSPEELMILVERGGQQGMIEAEEEQMIGAVLELGERRVHEVMVPRIDIVALPVTATLDEIVDTIVREGHSRIPVYEDSIDNVVGILYVKDLLPYLKGRTSRRRSASWCGRRCSCPSRCWSTTCCTASSGARSTSRSCSTSTAARPAWSRSRT